MIKLKNCLFGVKQQSLTQFNSNKNVDIGDHLVYECHGATLTQHKHMQPNYNVEYLQIR